MNTFIGRSEEIAVLQTLYRSEQSAFVPIYGRRRVGKSELILQFMKGKAGIYLAGKRAQAELHIREFLQESATALGEPLLAQLAVDGWKSALSAVLDKRPRNEKLVLVFDEFQWIAEGSPELPSILQEFWDRRWRSSGDVMLILCGSFVGFMEREVLGRKSPLFGRRTAQIHLKPFGFREAGQFHDGFSVQDRAKVYFICGGVPLYLQFFSSHHSVSTNIAQNLLNQYAPLFQEPEFLLREELREVENYYAVLLAIASGLTSLGDIARQTHIDNRALHYYLKQLVQLGYLSRRHPLTGVKPNQKAVRYFLDDPLLRFWFRFIYPNTSYVQQVGGREALRSRIGPLLDAYFGLCFERLCREALPVIYRREGIDAPFEIGEYWDARVQIDVIGYREDNWTDVGECKWGAVRSPRVLAQEVSKKVTLYPNPRNATIGRRIFTRSPVRKKGLVSSEIRWHSLEDLYSVGD